MGVWPSVDCLAEGQQHYMALEHWLHVAAGQLLAQGRCSSALTQLLLKPNLVSEPMELAAAAPS